MHRRRYTPKWIQILWVWVCSWTHLPMRYVKAIYKCILKLILRIHISITSSKINPRWEPQNTLDDKSKLVQVMVWCVWRAITWANVGPHQCCHMVSLGHNELIMWVNLITFVTYVCRSGHGTAAVLFPGFAINWLIALIASIALRHRYLHVLS